MSFALIQLGATFFRLFNGVSLCGHRNRSPVLSAAAVSAAVAAAVAAAAAAALVAALCNCHPTLSPPWNARVLFIQGKG